MNADLLTRYARLLACASTLALGACATLAEGESLSLARATATNDMKAELSRLDDDSANAAAKAKVAALLKRPLTADSAVRIAFLNNRGLQADLNALGIAEAQYQAASLPPSPRFSLSRLAGGLDLEIERQIIVGLMELATLPARQDIAADKFKAAQYRAAEAVLRLGLDTRRQYYRAVGASELGATLETARASADASSDLVKALGESGAVSKLQQARQHAVYAEISAQLGRARLQRSVEREKLIRLLGLWGRDAEIRLPASLPALAARANSAASVEKQALERRADLHIARLELTALAKSLGLAEATRFMTDIELAGVSNYERSNNDLGEKEKTNRRGLSVEFEIPLFDFGASKVALARETYMQAANRLAEKAVNVRSEAREAYQVYRGSFDLARHYQSQILPLRKVIQEESLLHYSGMLTDVGELLADARAAATSRAQAVEARRDFWIADADLQAAILGGGRQGAPGAGAPTESTETTGGH
ncbi:TolC family protein [Terrarubrum flagellatum]|uniref:TolC family protein n=1 Tax=Terrirubrum flagellatum TaxID=2895980 RepID=UPI00314568B8